MADVLDEVRAERVRQNVKWGEQNHPDGTGPVMALLGVWMNLPGRDTAGVEDYTAEELAAAATRSTDAAAHNGAVRRWLRTIRRSCGRSWCRSPRWLRSGRKRSIVGRRVVFQMADSFPGAYPVPYPKFSLGDRVRVKPGWRYSLDEVGAEYTVTGITALVDRYVYWGDPRGFGCSEDALELADGLVGERDRARRTAMRLEQELAEEQQRVRVLNVQLRLLEVQRRGMLRLLDAWEDRMQRIHDSRLTRSAPQAIEECRREVSRVIECGPPIATESREGWRPAGGLVSE